MIQINETIEFEPGVELLKQNQAFQDWFNENIQSKITFADGKNDTVQTCSTFDEFEKPLTWEFDKLTVKAIYWTIDEKPEIALNPNYKYNYNFNKFMINGTI